MLVQLADTEDICEIQSIIRILSSDESKKKISLQHLCILLNVSRGMRHSKLVYSICKHISSVISSTCMTKNNTYMCMIAIKLSNNNSEYKKIYGVLMNDFTRRIPLLHCYSNNSLSQKTTRSIFCTGLIDCQFIETCCAFFIQTSIENENEQSITNISVTLYAIHKCLVFVDGNYHFLNNNLLNSASEDTKNTFFRFVNSLIVNSYLISKYTHLDVIVVTILQAFSLPSTIDVIMEYIINRFYDCFQKQDVLISTFLQDTIIRLLSKPTLQVKIRTFLDNYDVVNTMVERIAMNQNIMSKEMHLCCLCLVTEMVGYSVNISTTLFERIEQLVYMSSDHTIVSNIFLHENYLLLLYNALYSHAQIIDAAVISRIVDVITVKTQQIHVKQDIFSGLSCIKYLIDFQRRGLTVTDLNRICVFTTRLCQHIVEPPYRIMTDILYILSVTSRTTDRETWFVTVNNCTVLATILSLTASCERHMTYILVILGNYMYKNTQFKYNEMAKIISYVDINRLVQNIQAGEVYKNSTLFQLLETLEVMISSKIERPEIILDNVIYIAQYIMGRRRIHTHFGTKISKILTRIFKTENIKIKQLNTNCYFSNTILYLTLHVKNYRKILDFINVIFSSNEEICLCNYDKNLCHRILSYCTQRDNNAEYWDFDTLIIIEKIVSNTAKSKNHKKLSGISKITFDYRIDELESKTASMKPSGEHWELLYKKITHIQTIKSCI